MPARSAARLPYHHWWTVRGAVVSAVAVAVVLLMGGAAADAGVLPLPPVWQHQGGTHGDSLGDTIANYEAGGMAGSQLWETDVRFTKSNIPVLLHDATLDQFGCPTVAIASVSVGQARTCVAPNGQSVSTLAQFATDLSTYHARAWVELKTTPTTAQWKTFDARLGKLKYKVIIQSFWHAALKAASAHGYTTALLASKAVAVKNLPAGTDWYAQDYATLTASTITAMHAAGIGVVVYTPARADWSSLPPGVDEIISNDSPDASAAQTVPADGGQ